MYFALLFIINHATLSCIIKRNYKLSRTVINYQYINLINQSWLLILSQLIYYNYIDFNETHLCHVDEQDYRMR